MKKLLLLLSVLNVGLCNLWAYSIGAGTTPQYVKMYQTAAGQSTFDVRIYATNPYSGSNTAIFRVSSIVMNSASSVKGSHSFSASDNNSYFVNKFTSSTAGYYIDPGSKPLTGTITFTYKSTNSSGVPVYTVSVTNGAGYFSGTYASPFVFNATDLPVYAYESDGSTPITLTDDGINITATNIDTYIDNTGADAEWKYWLLAGTGTGSDNKQYTFTLKYNASTTVGTFASSLADAEVTSLYQGQTKIGYSSVATTVTEYKTGKYLITATFTGTNGKKYVVTADYIDDCVATDDGGTQGDVPCTAYFTLDQMSITSQTTYGNTLCDAEWKTPSGWSKTFTVLQASNGEGASIKLFFSDISTQEYNGINSPAARDYAFANAGMDQDYTYLAETNCFNPIGNENLYYYGFIYDENGTGYIPAKWYDHSNVAVGKGTVYYGSNAYFPGGNSDPDNNYILPSYHTTCSYWSFYTCPGSSTKNYFDSGEIIHVEEKSDGSVFIQVRDKEDASMVYVQIGTTTVDQGGSGGGETVTPTIKLDTYVNGRGSVTVSPEECLYAEGAQIILTPTPESDDWTFTGWTGACANQVTDNGNGTYTYAVPANDCAVIANFTEGDASVDVTLDPNGGSGDAQVVSATNGSAMPSTLKGGGEIVIPTREGYFFDGYVENADGSGTKYYNADLTSANNWDKTDETVLYAKWIRACTITIADYPAAAGTVTVYYNYGQDYEQYLTGSTFTTGSREVAEWDYITAVATVNAHYTLVSFSWSGEDFDFRDDPHHEVDGSHTIYAVFEGEHYNVTYLDKDGAAYSGSNIADLPVQHTYGTQTDLVPGERTGYTFGGWYEDAECNGAVVTSLGAETYTTDITLYAKWTPITYTVTFRMKDEDGGQVLWSESFAYNTVPVYGGEMPAKEAEPGRVNTFTGWTDGVNEYPVGTELPAVTDVAVYFAMFVEEVADYTVRFEDFDGGELLTLQLEPNAVPSYEGTPARENEGDEYNWYEFAFTGWTDGDNNTYADGAELPAVTANVTYTAQYSKKLYIILQENMDADYYTNFHNKYNGERATTATLNRQFEQGQWATLCFPFNVSTAQLTSLGMINRIYDFKYTKGDEQEGITLYFSQAKKLEAGKGYIVNANAALAKKESFVFANALINTAFDEQSGFDIANLQGYNSQGNIYLVGTLRTGTLYGSETGSRYMGLKDNKIYYPNSDQGTSLRAYRGIFLNTGEESLPARVRIVAANEDGETVTELEVVNGNLEETSETKKFIRDGILYIERNGQLFDAKGHRAE